LGYERLERVESRGHFAVRGGLVDVFPMTAQFPVRIEFWGDEIDSIRAFEPDSQRSVERLSECTIGPAREFLLSEMDLSAPLAAIERSAGRQAERLQKLGHQELADSLLARTGEHLARLVEWAGAGFAGVDQYKPFFYPQLATLFSYVSQGVVVLDEPARVREHLHAFMNEFGERQAMLLERGRSLPDEAKIYCDWPDFLAEAKAHPVLYLSALNQRAQGMEPEHVVHAKTRQPESFHGQLERLLDEVKRWRDERYSVCIVLSTPERTQRLGELLDGEGLPSVVAGEVNGQLKSGNIVLTTGALESGSEYADSRLVVLTDHEVYGRMKRRRRASSDDERRPHVVSDFRELKAGDFVVHINHGVGKYIGVETLTIGGVHKDFLVVKYAGEDKLFVPTDQVDMLQTYVGVESQEPKLNKLGGGDWARVKKRVKESVRELAEGLLQLYAEREAAQGHAYPADSPWQKEFEDAFPYEETPDQLRAIREVKHDMESTRPMDRLLCGDVGYGKTEVAIRAAFKAVQDGQQVAVLVPTTILAQQHGRTFIDRFEGYPVTVKVISRFQSAAEQKRVIQGLADGSVDIVIGTHRLLSKDVTFKALGLVVVDEEQRFGVQQKERLKELRKEVDVLTLTATPIPRTLHMAMAGARDMSVIETPPEDRYPIRTYVVEYNEEIIREAIMRELAREGQVYFVYNRVRQIEHMLRRLNDLVPEARVGVAHGQMSEDQLERIMLEFLEGEYDVLLCSTIIETGMDIANVNTLIIYEADRLGLAQLYQLRGRVGRSNRVAYAYFTYHRDKVLSEEAEKRLHAIKEFTDLGSGFKIAMRDLEIRGAGSILGAEQHGHIAAVGFEMYCRLLEDSVRELQGKSVAQLPEPVIDLKLEAYIPDDYIEDTVQKVELYKRVLGVRSLEGADELEEEVRDRFGEVPKAVHNLVDVARLKVAARHLGVAQIDQERDEVIVKLHTGLGLPADGWNPLIRQHRGRLQIQSGRNAQVKLKTRGLDPAQLVQSLRGALEDVAAHWERLGR
ncbi:MAG TPA: transcription-repair coupling factor, partial [Limnochordia bacterium]|nr:transcription-repair coupling factor [Limnochordia bacterium]